MRLLFALLFLPALSAWSQGPRVIADCTVMFDVTVTDSSSAHIPFQHAVKTLYIKGNETRSDLVAPSFRYTAFHNSRNGQTTVLQEVGEGKYMSVIDPAGWREMNKRFEGMKVDLTGETREILNYSCRKALVTTRDGKTLTVFYVPDMQPSAMENEYQFRGVPGFVLEYETLTEKGARVRFVATSIDLNPVPSAKFEIPQSGYRILK